MARHLIARRRLRCEVLEDRRMLSIAGFEAGTDIDPPTVLSLSSVSGLSLSATPTAVDLLAASDTGISDSDDITNLDNSSASKTLQFEVSGTVAGAMVTVYSDGVAIGSAVASGTTTTVTTDGSHDLPNGSRSITARQAEVGKDESENSVALGVTIDTVEPWQIDHVADKQLAADGIKEDYFGYSVSVSGDTAIVGAHRDDDNSSESGSAYILQQTAGAWEQVAKLTANDGAENDHFGHSVSIDGDTAIVGAYWDGDNGRASGSAYIFQRTAGLWEQVAKLTADDGAENDCFGHSVSISGTTVIVGALHDDDNGVNSGSVYIFQQTAGVWGQVAKLTADDGADYDRFGDSVSISGTTAVVGASCDDDHGDLSGSAYIFQETAGVWEQVTKLTADDGATDDYFGHSVSISDTTVIVGAYGDNDNGNDSGSAYVFQQTATGWEQVTKLTPDDGAIDDRFGISVSISGTAAIVGASRSDGDDDNFGAAYIFQETATGWEQVTKLTDNDGAEEDYFGTSVSISGTTAIVGAYGDDDNGTASGSVSMISFVPTIDLQSAGDTGYSDTDNITNDTTPSFDMTATPYYRVYRDGVQVSGDYETAPTYTSSSLSDGTYGFTAVAVDEAGNELSSLVLSVTIDTVPPDPTAALAKLLADDGTTSDYFGNSVSIDGDTAIVGSYGDDDAGSAYIFRQTDGVWEQIAKLTPDDGAYGDYFGISVSINGDTAIVGAYRDDDTVTDSGSAYIFRQTGSGWEQVAKLTADDGTLYDYFGYSVSIDGTTAIVGAYNDDDNGSNSGSAYIFQETAGVWGQSAKLTATDGAASDCFGFSVAIDGTTAIVGAVYDDDNGAESGSAYIFQETAGVWGQVAKLAADDGAAADFFGYSVSISGATAIVGAKSNSPDFGSAYIFRQTTGPWEQIAKLTSDDATIGDCFGCSVSIDGATAIVGAYYNSGNSLVSGSAYIFQETAGVWEQGAKLTAGDGATFDRFGYSVSVSGTTIIVGALRDDDNGNESGSAYIFSSVLSIDLQAASDTGHSDTDNITSDNTPTFDIGASPYYRVYRNGVQIGGDRNTTPYTSLVLPNGTYEFTVVAVDQAGNETPPSPPLTVTIEAALIPGDANLDNKVDSSDLGIFGNNWQAGAPDGDPDNVNWCMGDFNGDGKVDSSDFGLMANNWQVGVTSTPLTISKLLLQTAEPEEQLTQYIPPADASLAVTTVPLQESLPPRHRTIPMPDLKDVILAAESTWNEADYTAVAKDLAAVSAERSTSAEDKLFALKLDPYADF